MWGVSREREGEQVEGKQVEEGQVEDEQVEEGREQRAGVHEAHGEQTVEAAGSEGSSTVQGWKAAGTTGGRLYTSSGSGPVPARPPASEARHTQPEERGSKEKTRSHVSNLIFKNLMHFMYYKSAD